MMDANQIGRKKLFNCKFCNKKFPCGKSLGGHIRIHLNGNGKGNGIGIVNDNNPAGFEDEIIDLKLKDKKDSYELRENPKKSKRFVGDSKSNQRNLIQAKVCKECGKEFQSLKALCGHMAFHSKPTFENQSGTSEKLKDHVFDTQSDTDTSSAPSKRRRSARTRYKSTVDVCVSDISDDIEQEQEEVALCLMQLSKDSGFKGGLTSDFSDHDSKSSPKLRISVKNGVDSVYNANGALETKKSKKGCFENSDTGYFRHEPRKVKLCTYDSYESDENSIETEYVPNRKKIQSCNGKSPATEQKLGFKKGKLAHECPFCCKVFRSGQALGGHKRSHFVGGSEDRTIVIDHQVRGHKRSHFVGGSEDRTVVIDHQVPEVSVSGLIDLNFPPPIEEDTNSYCLASW